MIRTAAIITLAAATGALSAPPAAANFEGGSDGNGFTISVNVTVTSDSNATVRSGSRTLHIPPKCWWVPAQLAIDGTDTRTPDGFKQFMDETRPGLTGHAAAGRLAIPSQQEIDRVATASAGGQGYTWYQLECQDGVNGADEGYTSSGGNYYGMNIPVSYRAFLPGQVPEPLVAAEDLIEILWDEARDEIAVPVVGRNPRLARNNGATLVNLPTWFWVSNPDAALAGDGILRITATAGSATATLTALTQGVDITSVAGSRQCTVDQVKTAYRRGASEANACTIAFSRSNAGWPVTASITWAASWTGRDSTGTHSGELDPVGRTTTFNVPVIEAQAVVR